MKEKQEQSRAGEADTAEASGQVSPQDSTKPLASEVVLDPHPGIPAGILEQGWVSLADFLKAEVYPRGDRRARWLCPSRGGELDRPSRSVCVSLDYGQRGACSAWGAMKASSC